MATELAKGYVQIVPSAKGIKGSLGKILSPEADSAGKAAGMSAGNSLISSIKGIVAAAGIGAIIKQSITEGGELEQSIGGIGTLFGSAADKMKAYANNAYKDVGMSANEYMQNVTSFSASLKASMGGDAADMEAMSDAANQMMKDMADNANKMGTPLESITNAYQGFAKQNYTMLDNLKLGYGGTKSEMERLLADAEKLSGVHYEMDNLADMGTAIKVIQDNLGITGTTAKEAASTLQGSLGMMKSAAKDLLANLALGENGIKGAKDALGALIDSAITFVGGNLVPALGNILGEIPTLITEVFNRIADNADGIVNSGIEIATNLVTGLAEAIPAIVEAAGSLLVALGKALISADWKKTASSIIQSLKGALSKSGLNLGGMDFLTQMVQKAGAELPGLLDGLGEIVNGKLREFMSNLPSLLKTLSDSLFEFIDAIADALPGLLESLGNIVLELVNTIIQSLPGLISSFGEILAGLIERLDEIIPVLLEWGFNFVTSLMSGIIEGLPAIIESLATVIWSLVTSIAEHIPDMLEAGKNLLGGIISGFAESVPGLLERAAEMLASLLSTIAQNLPQLIQSGIEMVANLVAGLIRALPQLIKTGLNIVTNLRQGIIDAIPKLLEAGAKLFKSFKDKMLETDWLQLGKDLLKGIANGIISGVGVINDAIKDVAKEMLQTFKDFFKIGSPSKLMEDEIGQWIPPGIARGVVKNMPIIDQTMDGMLNNTLKKAEKQMHMAVPAGTTSEQSMLYELSEKMEELTTSITRLAVARQNIVLQGDAAGVFRLVKSENDRQIDLKGYNPLAD